MANMKDVAERAGVSTATVSHVINETRFVAEETRNEVLKAMKELKYYPNSAARILRKKESKIIGLVVPDISNFFFTGLARKIETVIKKKGYNIILGNSDEKIENEVEQIKIMNSYLIDGLIMAPARGDQSYLDEDFLADNNFPIVFIDRMPKGYHGDCVLVDNEHASYKAVNYLIQQGHRRIGIITGLPELTTTEERLIGYKKAF
ncbi:MAG: LacI family DNA-binding transcriptional regulator, partial [Halanaerobiaceae bacterium]